MSKKVLIVEDQFVEANDLQLILKRAGYEVCGIARSVAIAQEMIKKEKPDFVLLDIFLKGKLTGIDLAKELRKDNIAFIYLSANSNEEVLSNAKTTEPYGFLVKPFRERDLLIMLEIARYRHEHNAESIERNKSILNEKLSAISYSNESTETKLLNICRAFQTYIAFDYITVGFNTLSGTSNNAVSFLRIGFDEYQKIGISELSTISRLKLSDILTFVNTGEIHQLISDTFKMKSSISWNLSFSGDKLFTISFYSRHDNLYNSDHTVLFNQLQNTMTTVIENIFKGGAVAVGKSSHPSLLSESVTASHHFEGIIGNSYLLLNVFDQITQVAPFDTSVLLLGESGTGKERIADCIHNLSSRKGKALIKINCATLPATLIESELFGHEKGSFTGAIEKRTGKFELANGGTIFLDEIGEMPVDLQVKLLRVLQEKEIEPIGARSPIKINVRVIAATNRNLEKEVAEGRFRLDLYYRLNVFPIELPPLRDRIEDIPALAYHFINIYNRKSGKKITGLSDKVLKSFISYEWPGNIRELEHVIERSVLLAKSTVIEEVSIPVIYKKEIPSFHPNTSIKTINENERDYIIEVLKKCNGRVWGVGGAAELLNIPPSTLKSKMNKLGISKHIIE
ncbi:sigma 54-interacting transcriptional regulator [Terrimonas alba]|uniref:sigma 54-interacting transcriptional regulator n=1 Tax=Terrimonas alba TaxID=3349636 RepID=UPI0035F42941